MWQNLNVYIDNNLVEYVVIKNDNELIVVDVTVPGNLNNTLKSWNYLRNEIGNYFDINFNEIGQRIILPHTIKMELKLNNQFSYCELKFDSIDEFTKI